MPWLWLSDPAAWQQVAGACSDGGFCALDSAEAGDCPGRREMARGVLDSMWTGAEKKEPGVYLMECTGLSWHYLPLCEQFSILCDLFIPFNREAKSKDQQLHEMTLSELVGSSPPGPRGPGWSCSPPATPHLGSRKSPSPFHHAARCGRHRCHESTPHGISRESALVERLGGLVGAGDRSVEALKGKETKQAALQCIAVPLLQALRWC